MDALCHATESVWSVNRTDESYGYAREAIGLILSNIGGYLANDDSANHEMLRAANLAGHAINITQTTAGHAMCYKITSLFGSAHGHAAALCDRVLFPWMAEITDPAIASVMADLASCYGCSSASEAAAKFVSIFDSLSLEVPSATEDELAELCSSVNPVRLKNHPVTLDHETIEMLYRKILNVK